MATSDLTITDANVKLSTSNNGATSSGKAGATLAKVTPVYRDANDSNRLKPGNCDAASTSNIVGVTITNGVLGDSIDYKTNGDIVLGGGILTAFETYVLSSVDGKIMLPTDLASGDTFVIIGHAIDTNTLRLAIKNTGVVKA